MTLLYLASALLLRGATATKVNAEMNSETDEYMIPTSCKGLKDGEYLLKLIDDDAYPLIYAQCSNDYAILDYNMDSDWVSYLSSFKEVYSTVGTPIKDDHCNWESYVLADVSQYLISPQCGSCDESDSLQIYDTATGYYHSPAIGGCVQYRISREACDMRFTDAVCQICAEDETNGVFTSTDYYDGINADADTSSHPSDTDITSIGTCPFLIESVSRDVITADEYETCGCMDNFAEPQTLKPSIGLDGTHCMCLQSSEEASYVSIDVVTVAEKLLSIKESLSAADDSDDDADTDSKTRFLLYNSDFEDGTYRITESGTYVIMEDITFDFKSRAYTVASDDSEWTADNVLETLGQWNGDDDAWWPTESDSDRYEGAGGVIGPYWMGFYAGIAVEADDVTLDLNGFSLQMSTALYYQQSFFALIALTSQTFIPFQGFGNFGTHPVYPSGATIKNGKLGLTSHHGIQGHFNKDLLIEDLQITQFKTHGIQLNGFTDVVIRNVEIYENQYTDKLRPFYSQMRHLLPVYKSMADDSDINDVCLSFTSRDSCVTMPDLVDELVLALDLAFEYAVMGKNWDGLIDNGIVTDEETIAVWKTNRDVFIPQMTTPQTSSVYGLFLNYPGANVLLWYTNNVHSSGATLENVYIHDLQHFTHENLGFTANQGPIQSPYQSPINAGFVFGEDNLDDIYDLYQTYEWGTDDEMRVALDAISYQGNTAVDMFVLAYELVRSYGGSWNYISGATNDFYLLADYALTGDAKKLLSPGFAFTCSQDPMFHPGKGIIGVRFNGVDDITIDGLTIENIYSFTGLGSELCGDSSGEPTHQKPYMNGFTMNGANALTITYSTITSADRIKIDNLQTNTGLAHGLALWFSADGLSNFGSDITISNIAAGIEVEAGTLSPDSGPNYAPEACAIRVYEADGVQYLSTDDYSAAEDWTISAISGEYGCGKSTEQYTSLGTVVATIDIDTTDLELDAAVNRVDMSHRSSRSRSGRLQMSVSVYVLIIALMIGVVVFVRSERCEKILANYGWLDRKSSTEHSALMECSNDSYNSNVAMHCESQHLLRSEKTNFPDTFQLL